MVSDTNSSTTVPRRASHASEYSRPLSPSKERGKRTSNLRGGGGGGGGGGEMKGFHQEELFFYCCCYLFIYVILCCGIIVDESCFCDAAWLKSSRLPCS